MPAFGLGTWRMGENRARWDAEIEVLRYALDNGVTLFDTAEMYGDGGAEKVLGAAVAGRRERCFIVSKVYPYNATRGGVVAACERSLRRLDSHYIDLYLLHWPGHVPLAETFAGFHELRDRGKIRYFGVSNFDLEDLNRIDQADQALLGSNQVYYNLARREAEWGVIPWCLQRKVPVMAYCPLDPYGHLLHSTALGRVATRHGATPAQIALAWLLSREQVVAIPKTSQRRRVEENIGALHISLSEDDLALLDSAHPPPSSPVSLRIT
jgi:diketogulonate reductase-like aldo/keto reductase